MLLLRFHGTHLYSQIHPVFCGPGFLSFGNLVVVWGVVFGARAADEAKPGLSSQSQKGRVTMMGLPRGDARS